jgi:hypothetical protein
LVGCKNYFFLHVKHYNLTIYAIKVVEIFTTFSYTSLVHGNCSIGVCFEQNIRRHLRPQ